MLCHAIVHFVYSTVTAMEFRGTRDIPVPLKRREIQALTKSQFNIEMSQSPMKVALSSKLFPPFEWGCSLLPPAPHTHVLLRGLPGVR